MPNFAANLSMLFTEYDFLDRFAAAADAGFKGVEYLFPYDYPLPELQRRLQQASLVQVLHNLPAGDWNAGERGIACLPGRQDEFKRSVDLGINYATGLGCKQVNCLAGLRPENVSFDEAWETMLENVDYAARQFEGHGITLLVEAINSRVDMPGFMLDSSEKAMSLLQALKRPNLLFQYDIYHMQIMEGHLMETMRSLLDSIGHIQFADNPGRHEPGTGEINFDFIFQALDQMGYRGWVSAEYRPLESTLSSLDWFKS
ncbi:hydroxypyruvate isomerase [Hahella sp. CCB-MM4]|uniref:hydroxypyruvate isomerase n=1 Tax=Hahella sp. (strain CCB-MM4) TaxID=1926491 RepID=UPI000B9C2289|nr:hydroxypyruvate isomerase [Hahella sp. CCB-MM4]OZG75126.1 hydroxypyruvate isomerase [Hahella sp. CCB-MM4]